MMLHCNYYVAVSDYENYEYFLSVLKNHFEGLQNFYDKESLIKSIEFLSQNQSYLDNNLFIVFAEEQYEHGISKYLKENLDDLNYVLISFDCKKADSFDFTNHVFDFIDLSQGSFDEAFFFRRLEAEILRKSRMTALKLQIREFYEIGKLLSSERDIYKLFDMIISTSLNITASDAVTLYLVADKATGEWASIDNNQYEDKVLKFVISKNLSISTNLQSFTIPITKKSITGYTAINGKALRIDDAYHIGPEMEYTHDSSFDCITKYKTVSMLSVPMKDRNNNVSGVIQLINKKKENGGGSIVPFDYFDELTMNSIAGQAAVALENNLLYKNINELLQRYVKQNERLTVLSDKILKAHEEERKRIARDIHDGPAQSAACLALKLELCKKQLQMGAYDALAAELDKLGEDMRSTVKEIRTVIYDLKPSYLDVGMFAAIQNHIDNFSGNTGLVIEFKAVGQDSNVEKYIVSTVFRIVQEALTNINKHAKASKASVLLQVTETDLLLIIEDDGKGFDISAMEHSRRSKLSGGFGIEGMKERVELLNGSISFSSAPGKGTSVRIIVPFK